MKTFLTLIISGGMCFYPISVLAESTQSNRPRTGTGQQQQESTMQSSTQSSTSNSPSTQSGRQDSKQKTQESQFSEVGQAGSGTYEQAQKAQDKANNTSMLGMMIAMAAMPACASGSAAACVLAAAGMMVSAMGNKKAKEAGQLKNNLGVGGGNGETFEDQSDQETSRMTDQLSRLKGDLAGKGYGLDANGNITLPNGEVLAEEDFNAEDLQNKAGLSPAQANKLLADLEKAKEGAGAAAEETSIASTDSGYSGGKKGNGGLASGTLGDEASNDSEVQVSSVDKERDPAAWDGYFRRYGDSNVGVANGDLFRQVEKRVDKERKRMGM